MLKKIILVLFLLPATLSLFGQWSTNPAINNVICNLTGDQAIPKIAVCPNGDVYIGYFSNESGNYDVRLQRLDALGNIMWAANGILISNNLQNTWLTDWDMTADPANHAILTFNDVRDGNTNVYAYRISPSGSFVWGANGVALSSNTAFNAAPKVIATSAGNIVAAWMSDQVIVMQKINAAGTLQWGTSGITISGANTRSWPQLMPVGTDEFIMKYYDDSGVTWSPTRHVYAQKYNSAGAPVWTTATIISNAGGISAQTQVLPFISDNSGGFYIAWDDDRDNNLLANSFVQHVNATGQVLFPANGVAVSTETTMNHWYPELGLPTGSQEVYVFWNEINGNQNQWGIMAQKISSTGTRQWTENGMTLIPVSSTNIFPLAGRNTPTDMVLFVEEYSGVLNSYIKAMRIASDGSFVWTPLMKPVSTFDSQKIHTDISEIQNEQWIVAWEDARNTTTDIYAQNISLAGAPGPVSFGTLSGTISLNGGFGNVTQTTVQAGSNTTNPDATGHYTINLTTGSYTVTATLSGYNTASQTNVQILNNQTTTTNLTLNAIPAGKIEGDVTLLDGTGQVWNVTITAGTVTTHPDVNGHYSMLVTPGTFDIIATLNLYSPDTNQNVTAILNQTTSGVDFALQLAPTTGFIDGTVTLNGGTGLVTEVEINAGGNITHPNANGFYSMELQVGNYDVIASLTGYATQFQMSTPVLPGQTTHNVDFMLTPAADVAYIMGHINVNGTISNITEVVVTAGTSTTHPNASGDYSLEVASGIWDVSASHDYTDTQTITGIELLPGQTASNIDLTINVIRTDLICRAYDQWGDILNNCDVMITGPEETYTGTITNDYIVFEKALYGHYQGEANLGTAIADADTTINALNSEIHFLFILGGTTNLAGTVMMQVTPNPVTTRSELILDVQKKESFTLQLIGMQGETITAFTDRLFTTGNHAVGLNQWTKGLSAGTYIIKLSNGEGVATCKIIIGK